MIRKTFALILSAILLSTAFGLKTIQAQTGKDAQLAGETRAKVQKLGLGRDARVEVKLRDTTKLKGYISEAGQDSFTVTDSKTGAAQSIAYLDVAQVKKPGSGLSTRGWVIIGAAAVAAVIVAIVVKPAVCDGGAQSRFPC
jgi:hypothetical protein